MPYNREFWKMHFMTLRSIAENPDANKGILSGERECENLVEDILYRVHGDAVQVDFVMQVWCRASSAISYQGDFVSTLDTGARFYQIFLQMTVPCHRTISVFDHNAFAEAPFSPYKRDSTVGRRNNCGTHPCSNIDALVKLFQAGERGYSMAKPRGKPSNSRPDSRR